MDISPLLPMIMEIRDEEDQDFVATVYATQGAKMLTIACHYIGNEVEAEDCVHDVVGVLIDYLQDYKMWNEDHQLNFLMKCCRCISINKYVKNRKRAQREILQGYGWEDEQKSMDFVDEDANVEDIVISEENVRMLRQAIESLKPIYADVLYLSLFLEMKNVDIANMLEISEALVSVRLKRAKQCLLTEYGEVIEYVRKK